MTRGTVVNRPAHIRAEKALEGANWTHVQYSMVSGLNGGTNPEASDCSSTWHDKKGETVHTSDCVGFALWACGFDRWQRQRFPLWGGWINTDSLVEAALKGLSWVGTNVKIAEITEPSMGAVVVYPSYRRYPWSIKKTPGHIGVILADGSVAHCHGPPLKGDACGFGHIGDWLKHKGAMTLWINYPSPKK